MVEIRRARLADVDELAKMGLEIVKYHEKYGEYFKSANETFKSYKKFFKSCIHAPNKLMLVAEVNGKPVAYCLGWEKKRPPVYKVQKVGYISDVYVKAPYRRRGIADSFLIAMHDWFKSRGLKYSELAVVAQNDLGFNAWKKHGFKPFMIQKHQKLR